MPSRKKALSQKSTHDIEKRLPSVAGWLSESNTFKILADACRDNLGNDGLRIGVIRGPAHAAIDGAIIVDPPEDFPFDDPTAAWKWAQKYRSEKATPPFRLYRFDAKLGVSSPKPGQWAPFFIVTVPEFTTHVCIVPIRSYFNLFNVHRRTRRYYDPDRLTDFPCAKKELVFTDYLAPFAVHKDDVYAALVSVTESSRRKSSYVNPTNGLIFKGWQVPDGEATVDGVFRVHQKEQQLSRDAIEGLSHFLDSIPDLELTLNPVDPLVCDLMIVDRYEGVTYQVEHKYLAPGVRSSDDLLEIPASCKNEKMNWHFLFNQSGNRIAVHTRQGQDSLGVDEAAIQRPCVFDMTSSESGSKFLQLIRTQGKTAKSRLRSKWQNHKLFDDSIPEEPNMSQDDKGVRDNAQTGKSSRGKPASESQLVGLEFRELLNVQCYQRRRHGCILLHNHPCAQAVLLEHVWDADDVYLYETAGLLPVSLIQKPKQQRLRCILIRFMPHRQPTTCASTSQLFELAMQYSFDIPICPAQDFIYVATTGGIPKPGQKPCLDSVVLLPSSSTSILGISRDCATCEDGNEPRAWTTLQHRIRTDELGGARKPFSLTQLPIINADAEPLKSLYSFESGAVHQYFSDLFASQDTRHVTDVFGSDGILQRQWNHGDLREQFEFGDHPSDRLFQRVMKTLSFQENISPHLLLNKDDLDKKIDEITKTRSIEPRLAKTHALHYFIDETSRGIRFYELLRGSGFTATASNTHCDQCPDEESCKFLHPSVSNALLDVNYCCGGCHRRKIAGSQTGGCTIRRMLQDILLALRDFIPFWPHVPCHRCWSRGSKCNNEASSCENCREAGVACEREACVFFNEPRDDSFCRNCDMAHHDDGYKNVVTTPRGEGYNAEEASHQAIQRARQHVDEHEDERVAVCNECWAHNRDDLCTNETDCEPCKRRMRNRESVSCRRIKCKRFTSCSNQQCTLAHASHSFPEARLDEHISKRPRRLQGKETNVVYARVAL